MGRLIRRLALRSHAPRCCNGEPMDWDVIRASYVCGSCGRAR
jgi:hypothetical protein